MEPPPMDRQVAEIASEPDRAAAYARLLLLQRGCADDASSAAELAAELPSTLLPLLLRDAAADDEAVAASALKCLGFALYHPVLVYTISGTVLLVLCARISSVKYIGVG
jgi:telomere-associated protein RIF1